MFSLTDDIEKFQKQVLTLPESIITIDERYLGGGIKMQDLITQNSFIINQMRKMKEVFVNYCKLNDKIYKKIVQHEVNSNEQFLKILNISSHIDQTIEDSNQQLKKYKEQIQRNISNIEVTNEVKIIEVTNQVNKKVNEQGFHQKIIKVLEIHEQSIVQSCESQQKTTLRKKNRHQGLSTEDLNFIKVEITNSIQEINNEIKLLKKQSEQGILNHDKLLARTKQIQLKNNWLNEDLVLLRQNVGDTQKSIQKTDRQLRELIYQNINETIWKQKFDKFYYEVLKPEVSSSVQRIQLLLNQYVLQMNQTCKNISQDVHQKNNSLNEKIFTLNEKINENRLKFQEQSKRSANKMSEFQSKITIERKRDLQKLINTQNKVYQIENSIVTKLQDQKNRVEALLVQQQKSNIKVLKQKLQFQTKDIKVKFLQCQRNIQIIKQKQFFNEQQTQHLKNTVSTKANNSDLLKYFDQKVDRQEFYCTCEKYLTNKQAQSIISYNRESSKKIFQSQKKLKTPKQKIVSHQNKFQKDAFIFSNSQQMVNKGIPKRLSNSMSMRNKSARPTTASSLFFI